MPEWLIAAMAPVREWDHLSILRSDMGHHPILLLSDLKAKFNTARCYINVASCLVDCKHYAM